MVTETVITKGYKQTEVGVIPEDWDTPFIGELFTFKNGLNKAKEFFGYGTPIVNYMDIYEKRDLFLRDINGRVNVSKEELKAFEVRKGDVFFTRTSETAAEVGITSVMLDEPKETVFSGFVLRARPKDDSLDDQYKKYCFSSSAVRKQITSKSTETTRALTSGRLLSTVVIARPAKPEQTAIATALSDADTLISKLENLISKKRNIKQGAMQELLTGKKRLPGFSGKWKMKKLGDVCGKITTGKLDANAMVQDGEFRFYTCAKEYYWIDTYAFDTEALLVSGNGANVGYIHYYKGRFNAYQRTYVLYDFYEDIMFTKLFMDRYLQERIRVEVNAGNTPYITMGTLSEMQIKIPSTREEQTAIAQVLSDMDAEIEQLEQKLDKYKMLKQGMMQELLTGRTRLL